MTEEMEKICLHCESLLGCPYLGDSGGVFVPERVFKSGDGRECPHWRPVGPLQQEVRTTLYGLQGEGSIRVMHQMPQLVMKDIIQQEAEYEMSGDMPDFAGMIRDGMTKEERAEQIEFETDENGNVIVDEDGRKRPRPSYVLRKYACSEEIGLDHSVGMFWNNEQIIKFILERETEDGRIVKPKKGKPKPKGPTKGPESKEDKETNKMAGRRVLLNRDKKAADTKGAGKVAKPPARKGATKGPAAAEEEAPATEAAVAAPSFDMKELVDEVKVAVGGVIDGTNKEQDAKLDHIIGLLEEIRDSLCIFHDVMVQTGGTMEGADTKFEAEDKLLDYLNGDGDSEEGGE